MNFSKIPLEITTTLEIEEPLWDAACLTCVAGTWQNLFCTWQRLCHVLHTANRRRQSHVCRGPFSGTQQSHCRVFYRAHGKIKLPRQPSMPRGLFAVCHMVRHTANNATLAVCHVDRHTAKNGSFGSFAVCLAMAHGKKWWHTAKLIFRFLFFV